MDDVDSECFHDKRSLNDIKIGDRFVEGRSKGLAGYLHGGYKKHGTQKIISFYNEMRKHKGLWITTILLILLLNIYFIWTAGIFSGIVSPIPTPSQVQSGDLIQAQAYYQMKILHLYSLFSKEAISLCSQYNPQSFDYQHNCAGADLAHLRVRLFIDDEVIALFVAIMILSLLIYRNESKYLRVLKMLRLCSLSTLPLGIEILIFGRSSLWIQASVVQLSSRWLSWFSNADLLLLVLAVFIISDLLILRARPTINHKPSSSVSV